MKPFEATITRCRNGQALVELDSQPFNGLALRPAELRALAQQLNAVCDMAGKLPTGGKHWRATKVSMGVLPAAATATATATAEQQS